MNDSEVNRMRMYRALPRKDWDANPALQRLATRRVPSHVPYLVDNIWEYLRPPQAPSRRHAIYASPDPEQAAQSASRFVAPDNPLVICEVRIDDPCCRTAHLSVKDARYHGDIEKVTKFASGFFGRRFAEMGEERKLRYAPLFMPASSSSVVGALLELPELSELRAVAGECTLWTEASFVPRPGHDGELFFELSEQGVCRLVPLG